MNMTGPPQSRSFRGTFSIPSTFVFWYAATVNRWVKRKTEARYEGRLRDSYVEELTEYSRKL